MTLPHADLDRFLKRVGPLTQRAWCGVLARDKVSPHVLANQRHVRDLLCDVAARLTFELIDTLASESNGTTAPPRRKKGHRG